MLTRLHLHHGYPPRCTHAWSLLRSIRSSHRLQSVHLDHLTVGDEPNVAGREGLADALGRDRVEFSLTVLAHVSESAIAIHVQERAQLLVVDSDVRHHERDARLEATNKRQQA